MVDANAPSSEEHDVNASQVQPQAERLPIETNSTQRDRLQLEIDQGKNKLQGLIKEDSNAVQAGATREEDAREIAEEDTQIKDDKLVVEFKKKQLAPRKSGTQDKGEPVRLGEMKKPTEPRKSGTQDRSEPVRIMELKKHTEPRKAEVHERPEPPRNADRMKSEERRKQKRNEEHRTILEKSKEIREMKAPAHVAERVKEKKPRRVSCEDDRPREEVEAGSRIEVTALEKKEESCVVDVKQEEIVSDDGNKAFSIYYFKLVLLTLAGKYANDLF